MNEESFIQLHKPSWLELAAILDKIKAKGIKRLSKDELERLGNLYRKVSANLSYARSHLKNPELAYYLNQLVANAYNQIYTTESLSLRRILNFLSKGFPRLFQKSISYIAFSFSIFLTGLLFGYLMAKIDYAAVSTVLPPGVSSIEDGLKKGQANQNFNFSSEMMPEVSSLIITNNVKVSFFAFAGGILFGVFSAYILFYNGLMIGAIIGLVGKYKLTIPFLALTLTHGIIELTAIFISGGAGLMLGYALINPGEYTRKDSLRLASTKAVKLIIGVVLLLIIAGIIEGFFTPLKINISYKFTFAILTAGLLILYLSRKLPVTENKQKLSKR